MYIMLAKLARDLVADDVMRCMARLDVLIPRRTVPLASRAHPRHPLRWSHVSHPRHPIADSKARDSGGGL
jgi:hypothetical protein